ATTAPDRNSRGSRGGAPRGPARRGGGARSRRGGGGRGGRGRRRGRNPGARSAPPGGGALRTPRSSRRAASAPAPRRSPAPTGGPPPRGGGAPEAPQSPCARRPTRSSRFRSLRDRRGDEPACLETCVVGLTSPVRRAYPQPVGGVNRVSRIPPRDFTSRLASAAEAAHHEGGEFVELPHAQQLAGHDVDRSAGGEGEARRGDARGDRLHAEGGFDHARHGRRDEGAGDRGEKDAQEVGRRRSEPQA